jgi:hypothetical protein
MHPMEIDRRSFCVGSLAAALSPTASAPSEAKPRDIFLSTRRQPNGNYAAAIHAVGGGDLNTVSLPARGHGVTHSPATGACVAFARRPGTFAVAFTTDRSKAPIFFTTPADRHFFGHGVFSPDGRLLFATENDFEAARGVISIWDVAAGYKRLGEFSSHGIGPHDIALLHDQRTIVVANGGIHTHPDDGRRPLNLPSMAPSLAYIAAGTGDLLEQHALPKKLHRLSIRHLGVGAGDRVVFGCQFKGPSSQLVSLLGVHRRGAELQRLDADTTLRRSLRNYVSSVAVDRTGELAVVTSSRGKHAVIIDIAAQRVIAHKRIFDVSGAASAAPAKAFILTNGSGDIHLMNAQGRLQRPISRTQWAWDNHACAA